MSDVLICDTRQMFVFISMPYRTSIWGLGVQPRKREGQQDQIKSAITPCPGGKCQALIVPLLAANFCVLFNPVISDLSTPRPGQIGFVQLWLYCSSSLLFRAPVWGLSHRRARGRARAPSVQPYCSTCWHFLCNVELKKS